MIIASFAKLFPWTKPFNSLIVFYYYSASPTVVRNVTFVVLIAFYYYGYAPNPVVGFAPNPPVGGLAPNIPVYAGYYWAYWPNPVLFYPKVIKFRVVLCLIILLKISFQMTI